MPGRRIRLPEGKPCAGVADLPLHSDSRTFPVTFTESPGHSVLSQRNDCQPSPEHFHTRTRTDSQTITLPPTWPYSSPNEQNTFNNSIKSKTIAFMAGHVSSASHCTKGAILFLFLVKRTHFNTKIQEINYFLLKSQLWHSLFWDIRSVLVMSIFPGTTPEQKT